MRVLIIGAGGHGQVVADILKSASRQGSDVQPCGYLDHNDRLWNQVLLDLTVLGSVDEWTRFDHDAVIVGVGDNETRRDLFDNLSRCGERFATARHPSAILSASCTIDQGSVVCAGVVVNTAAHVGANVILNTSCSVDHHNEIGDHAHIAPGARLGGDVTIGQVRHWYLGRLCCPAVNPLEPGASWAPGRSSRKTWRTVSWRSDLQPVKSVVERDPGLGRRSELVRSPVQRLPTTMDRVYLSPPHVGAEERRLLLEAFDSNWIAPIGPHLDRFELEFADRLQLPAAVALSSGTAALHLWPSTSWGSRGAMRC